MNQLICRKCETRYELRERRWNCDCGGLLDIEFEPVFDLAAIARRRPTLWRYREAIPLDEDSHIVSFDEGFSPLAEIEIAGRPVLIKQDHLFPTGSYKDRGATVLISKARELGVRRVVEDSSGNAGAAIAAYCAAARIVCDIYVPADTSAAKLGQIGSYGARLHKIPGSREDTAHAVWEAAQKDYYASHSWNPFFFHGTKTFAFEVCEQLGWKAPDVVVLPVGNGTLLLGACLGFKELCDAGVTDKMPRIMAVQAEACAPLLKAFRDGRQEIPAIHKRDTLAEGIAIAKPVRGSQIVEAVRKSGGDFIGVKEIQIKQSLQEMCGRGYYIEPTAAATIAGVREYLRRGVNSETIVSVFTGHGLKSTGEKDP